MRQGRPIISDRGPMPRNLAVSPGTVRECCEDSATDGLRHERLDSSQKKAKGKDKSGVELSFH